MPNHVHLVVEVNELPLSKIMHNASFRYASWVNHIRERTGHLFQGRFKSVLVENDAQLLSLVRYVHLNPVRAKMTASPLEYPWSSHRAYIKATNRPPWLTTELILHMFGLTTGSARETFEAFVTADMKNQEDDGKPLEDGTDAISRLKQLITPTPLISIPELEELVCRVWGLPSDALGRQRQTRRLYEARGALVWLATELRIASLTDVAKHVNRNRSTLSGTVSRFEGRVRRSENNKALCERLRQVVESLEA